MTECTGKPHLTKYNNWFTSQKGNKVDQTAYNYKCCSCSYVTEWRRKESEAQQLWTEDHG